MENIVSQITDLYKDNSKKELQSRRLHELERFIPELHRDGKYLEAPCPQCGGDDRFYAGDKTGYTLFTCRSCGHKQQYGTAWVAEPRPAVKPSVATPDLTGQIQAIRFIYSSFARFAQAHLEEAVEHLRYRGLAPAQSGIFTSDADLALGRQAGLGFINAPLYRAWHATLDANERCACVWAGLPDGDKRGDFTGHAAMFAGGRMGKFVFPYYSATGEIVDIRTRSISDKDTVDRKAVRYTSPKGKTADRGARAPYGVHLMGNAQRIVLTEGEFKTITANLLASVPTLGLRGINDWRPEYFDLLRRKLVILAFDNDANKAGELATIQIGRMLSANDIDVMVLPPARLGDAKGIDDFILANGGEAFRTLIQSINLITLSEYEGQLTSVGSDLTNIKTPRADVGTERQWRSVDQIDSFAYPYTQTVTIDEATATIAEAVTEHLNHYRRGNPQLLITAPAGVGKTLTTITETLRHAAANKQNIAVILPNHATIAEKIDDGTLADFQHIHGRNDENCKKNNIAQAIMRKGYSPGAFLCPNCSLLDWCKKEGYKSQFVGQGNRAYVQAHAFTGYPGGEDIVIADELGHKPFVETMPIFESDLSSTLSSGKLPSAQAELFEGLRRLWITPNLSDLDGNVFYEVLRRFVPGLGDVDTWGDGASVQAVLFDLTTPFVNGMANASAEDLPQQFGAKLITLLSEDVRRLTAGQAVTGRVRFVVSKSSRWLELTYSKGLLPGWYNSRPVIILNATADENIMRDLVGPLRVVAPQVAIAEGNEIVQDITYNNAKSSYLGDSSEAEKRRNAWIEEIRTHIDAHPGGEVDTTIIVAKALEPLIREVFPQVKLAHYGALEGRNDLQSGLTILASAVPVNLDAIKREALALYPGIDTSPLRRSVAFDVANAAGEYIAVEQIDGADPRLSALIAQHRDAMATQAVHRSRIIRQTGRKVVVMFARPIPFLPPTKVTTDRPSGAEKHKKKAQAIIDKLVRAAADLLAADGGFAAELLASGASVSINTAKKYLPQVCAILGAKTLDLPVRQKLANGAVTPRTVSLILAPEVVENITTHVDHARYNIPLITNVIYVGCSKFLPNDWGIDVDKLIAFLAPKTNSSEGAAAPEPETAVTQSGRWACVTDIPLVQRELHQAATGSPEKQRAGVALAGFLNATHDDRGRFRTALYELGIGRFIDWRQLATP